MILRIDGDIVIWRAGKGAEAHSSNPPLAHSLYNVKSLISSYVKRISEELSIPLSDLSVVVYISPKDKSNFRFGLSNAVNYKLNRKEMAKPIHFDDIYQYLIDKYDTVVAVRQEADDAMGIAQTADKKNSLIVSADKDMRMIEGWHWEMSDRKPYFADYVGHLDYSAGKIWGYGIKWFYAQMLMGDAIDNTPGIAGMGPAKTFRALDGLDSEESLLNAVVDIYKEHDHTEDYFLTNARMLWIRREEDEMWEPIKEILWTK